MRIRHRQWVISVHSRTGRYVISNPGPHEGRRYFMVVPGRDGEPIVVAEPDLALPVPSGFTYVDAQGKPVVPDQRIAGIVCQDGPRFSLTHARETGVWIGLQSDGSFLIDTDKWWPVTLFLKDRNRYRNYDAFLVRERREVVRVLELGDLSLF